MRVGSDVAALCRRISCLLLTPFFSFLLIFFPRHSCRLFAFQIVIYWCNGRQIFAIQMRLRNVGYAWQMGLLLIRPYPLKKKQKKKK